MGIPVLVRHDPGCRYAREDNGGHSDSARRFADGYNLHRLAGSVSGVIAVALADGATDGELYPDRLTAVGCMFPREAWYCYVQLQPGAAMSICEAASVLRWHRVMAQMHPADRDLPHGGPQVIPRLTIEGREHQIEAVQTGRGMLALGYRKEHP